jgi:two-component system sensor histidine kinase HydH
MAKQSALVKVALLTVLVVVITILHYDTRESAHYSHIIYQELYLVPLVLSAFWFGLRGGLITSIGISLLYLPFVLMLWKGFSPEDFSRIMEIALYNALAAIMGTMRDRELKKQERLLDNENLAAMGRALSAVAHDMKTPLIAIGGFSRLVQRHVSKCSCQEDVDCHKKLNIVLGETQRLETLVEDMLDFSRPLELHPSDEDIRPIIIECIAIAEVVAKEKKVNIQSQLPKNERPLILDPMRMKQVLINLLVNAVHASPEHEVVTVKCYESRMKVLIDVIDKGCGIPPDKREKIFHPFFTTKREGTGLGLPIAKKIIEAHRGNIQVVDNPEQGLTFRIVLPLRK